MDVAARALAASEVLIMSGAGGVNVADLARVFRV